MAQQSLFVQPDEAGELRPVAVSASLRELAATLPASVRLGTSSWSFPGWQGLVYAGAELDETRLARSGLASYAKHPLFRTVGVDRGFYAPVPPATLRRWYEDVPTDFRFLLKAHAALTTPKSARRPAFLQGVPDVFLDADYARREVIEPAQQALGSKLGVILFQFSPLDERVWRHRAALLDRLDEFLRGLPSGRYAFEWRDTEIFGDDYVELLQRHGAVHGFAAHPRLPPLSEQAAWWPSPCPAGSHGAPLVIRWLLARHLAYEEARARFAPFNTLCEPDERTRHEIVTLIGKAPEAIVIINNKAEGSAPLSVANLAQSLAEPTNGRDSLG